MRTWRYIDSGPGTGAENMAIDEGLLDEASKGEQLPLLRLYTWDPPVVSLGRFQDREASVNADACRQRGVDIVRRITGGRAVLHNHELTYCIIARTGNPLFPNDVLGTYKVVASGLVAGLRLLGMQAEAVSRSARHSGLVKKGVKDPACFSSPSWYEIVVNGRKIVGSAQRRLPHAFLQHGSILIDYDPELEAAVIPGGGTKDSATCIQRELGREVSLEEIKDAVLAGFSAALGMSFTRQSVIRGKP